MIEGRVLFSELIRSLSPEEVEWFKEQLQPVCVYDEGTYATDDIPPHLSTVRPNWVGPRFLSDVTGAPRFDDLPFTAVFVDSEKIGKHLWLYSTTGTSVQSLGILLGKFVMKFRPDAVLKISFAIVPEQPVFGAYGGGVLIITSSRVGIITTEHIIAGSMHIISDDDGNGNKDRDRIILN